MRNIKIAWLKNRTKVEDKIISTFIETVNVILNKYRYILLNVNKIFFIYTKPGIM